MASWNAVRRIAKSLPETSEREGHSGPQWLVKDKLFVWERPLRRSDIEALGDKAPKGAILGVRVADLDAKDVLLAENPNAYFTTPHFNGYPAVLIRLSKITVSELREVMTDAWLTRAPKRLAKDFLSTT